MKSAAGLRPDCDRGCGCFWRSAFGKNSRCSADEIHRRDFRDFDFDQVAGAQSFRSWLAQIGNVIDENVTVDFLRLSRRSALDEEFGFFAGAFDKNFEL